MTTTEVKRVYPDAKAIKSYAVDSKGYKIDTYVFMIYKTRFRNPNGNISEWATTSQAAWKSAYEKIKNEKNGK